MTRTENADPYCLPAEQAAALLRDAPWRRFAVMGDSFAAGVGGPSPGYADLPWAERVVAALRAGRPDLAYLNTGETGLRSAEVRQTQLDRVLAFEPDLVNIAAGGNDLLVRTPDLDRTEAELDAMYAAVRRLGADLVAFTVANVFDAFPQLAAFRDMIAALNTRIRAVAQRHGATLVEMWEHPVRTRPDLMSADGVHFSRQGHAVLASEVVKALAAVVASRRTAPAG
jgi:lysophospholipase L1-like esterase